MGPHAAPHRCPGGLARGGARRVLVGARGVFIGFGLRRCRVPPRPNLAPTPVQRPRSVVLAKASSPCSGRPPADTCSLLGWAGRCLTGRSPSQARASAKVRTEAVPRRLRSRGGYGRRILRVPPPTTQGGGGKRGEAELGVRNAVASQRGRLTGL